MLTQLPPSARVSDASSYSASAATEPQTSSRPVKRRKISDPSDNQSFSLDLLPYHSASLSNVRLNARPQFLFPRAKLPLYFLDASTSVAPSTAPSGVFRANIRTLEQPSSTSWLLVTKLDNRSGLFLVERIRHGLYSLSRLANWVTDAALRGHSVSLSCMIVSEPCSDPPQIDCNEANAAEWWKTESPLRSVVGETESRVVTPAPVAPPIASEDLTEKRPESSVMPAAVPGESSLEQTSLENIKPVLIQQYLDSLYCSKAPVSYFAKSAISRARAVANAANSSQDLSTFLRSIVLNVSMAEEKYKTSISDVIKSCVISEHFKDDTSPSSKTLNSKKPKAKKLKPRKNGLFPGEEDFIKSWWTSIDCIPLRASEAAARTTPANHIGHLRFRETLLQLVLCFETLYIEASFESNKTTSGEMTNQSDTKRGEARPATETVKPKRQRHLAKLIDVLIDKSIIWQSVDTNHVSDELKEFYLQLVGPFYGARLPGLVAQVGKKLGLSKGVSLKEPVFHKASDKVSKIAPGTEIVRSNEAKSRKSLQRVSSETLNTKRPHHSSLLRSMTDSMISKATLDSGKNERHVTDNASVTSERHSTSRSTSVARDDTGYRPLSRSNSISQREDSHRPLSRSGSVSLSSQSLKQREVDLSAIAKFKRAKPKKAEVEQELQDAITALKKPNRSLAAKKYMDAAEERVAPKRPRSKMSRNAVEVTSTPRRPDKAPGGIAATPLRSTLSTSNQVLNQIPASSPFVPMSEARQAGRGVLTSNSNKKSAFVATTPATKHRPNPVFETPSRGLEYTPRSSSITSQTLFEEGSAGNEATQTPTKAQTTDTSETKHPKAHPGETEASIYDVLGWDNDMDELA